VTGDQDSKSDTLVSAEEEKNMNTSRTNQIQLRMRIMIRMVSPHIAQARMPNLMSSDEFNNTSARLTERVSRLSSGEYRAVTISCLSKESKVEPLRRSIVELYPVRD
jgi:hypothetical protein